MGSSYKINAAEAFSNVLLYKLIGASGNICPIICLLLSETEEHLSQSLIKMGKTRKQDIQVRLRLENLQYAVRGIIKKFKI